MSRLIVTGAGGHLGQRVLSHLLDTLHVPAGDIIATTRDPDRLADWVARGVAVRAADFENAASLATAFAGGDRLLLISTDALDRPGRRLAQHRAAIAAAEAAGMRHVVYTSMPEPEDSPLLIAPDHLGTEQALAASALPGWTVLRNHWYFENLFFSMPHALASGQWYSAAGDGRLAYIARDDLALAAAVALTDGFEGQRTLTLGGAKAFSTEEIAALVSKATDKPLAVVHVPLEGLIQGMIGSGLPAGVATVFGSFDATAKAGQFEGDAKEFEALTGRKPRAFEDWLAENAAALSTPAAH